MTGGNHQLARPVVRRGITESAKAGLRRGGPRLRLVLPRMVSGPCDDLSMSFPASGPSSPPPPRGTDDRGPRRIGAVIAAVACGVVLILAACCLGGYFFFVRDDEGEPDPTTTSETAEETSEAPTTEEPSEEPTDNPTEEPTDETGTDPTTALPEDEVNFPGSFDGWDNLSAEPRSTIAIFMKEGDSFNVLSAGYASVGTYEKLWDSPQQYGDVSCGQREDSSSVSCAVEAHDTTYYATSADLTEEELAAAVQAMLREM